MVAKHRRNLRSPGASPPAAAAACEAWDQAQKARARLAEEGLTVEGREGGIRPHPCINIEHNARLTCARLVRELDLDSGPPVPERMGPPAIFSNRGQYARKTSRS